MRDRRFVDTNVLVYAFTSGDRRSVRAETVLEEGSTTGIQVINEFTNVAVRKLNWGWDRIDRALQVIDELLGPATPLTSAIYARAVACARRHGLPFYDALIVGAAQDMGCRILASEDFQHGRRFGDVVVWNPFLEPSQSHEP